MARSLSLIFGFRFKHFRYFYIRYTIKPTNCHINARGCLKSSSRPNLKTPQTFSKQTLAAVLQFLAYCSTSRRAIVVHLATDWNVTLWKTLSDANFNPSKLWLTRRAQLGLCHREVLRQGLRSAPTQWPTTTNHYGGLVKVQIVLLWNYLHTCTMLFCSGFVRVGLEAACERNKRNQVYLIVINHYLWRIACIVTRP